MKQKNAGLPISDDPLNLDGVKRSWFDRGGGLNVDKHRYFVIILLLLMLNLGQWWQYNQLFPLKTVRPFRVVENDAGKPVADFSAFKTYTPERADVEKTLRYWAKSLYTILGYKQSLAGLNEAKQLLIGQAISQFTEWLTTEQPAVLAHENPLMSRTVEIASLAVLPDNVAHIRIAVTTRSSDDSPPEVKHLLITLRYIYVRPEKEEDILKSANGVYINFFNVEPDRA